MFFPPITFHGKKFKKKSNGSLHMIFKKKFKEKPQAQALPELVDAQLMKLLT